jgi:YidC/Oxa1 family membrane protein insertase
MKKLGVGLLAVVAGLLLCAAVAAGQSSPPEPSSPQPSDTLAKAPALPSNLPIQITGSNNGFTKEPGEPNHAGGAGGSSAWYHWKPSTTENVVIETCGSTLDTLLGVYKGDSVNSLTEVASDDNACGEQSKVGFTAQRGTTYDIAVDGAHGRQGSFKLELRARNEPLVVLRPLVTVANGIVTFFHDNVGLSWGLAIVALTIVTRLAILPLSLKQIRSMRSLQALQPELKAIQARYKDDKQRQQREMMDFYKRNEINPLASCWPLLLQLPIFIALFYLLRGDEFTTEIHGAGWLGIQNLSDPATGATLIILLILYVATMVGSTSIMAASAEGPQRMLMFALPVIFVPFIINFPAGLVVYWITTNCWTMGQQAVVKKLIPAPAKPTEEELVAMKKPPPPPRKKKRRR